MIGDSKFTTEDAKKVWSRIFVNVGSIVKLPFKVNEEDAYGSVERIVRTGAGYLYMVHYLDEYGDSRVRLFRANELEVVSPDNVPEGDPCYG